MQHRIERVRKFIPAQVRIVGADGKRARIDLHDVDVRYDRGFDCGMEWLEIMPRGGDRTVIYGLEVYPGHMPEEFRCNEIRASEVTLRWLDGTEVNVKVKGLGGSLENVYDLIVDGIKPREED